MLWGPPDTLMNRTVVPALMLSLLGSNAATLVPLPVIFTSTTAPAASAAGAAAGTSAGVGVAPSAFAARRILFPPPATTPTAASVAHRVHRAAGPRPD